VGNVCTDASVFDLVNVGAPMFLGEPGRPRQPFNFAAKRPRIEWQITFDLQTPRLPRHARVINCEVREF
jgi:hypothetical protein